MGAGFVILSLALIVGCKADNVKSIVQGNDEFTAKTYKEVLKASGHENFILSGLSAEIVLSLLANGAEGNTRTQLLSGLSLPNNLEATNAGYKDLLSRLNINTDVLKLSTANKIYPAENFAISKKFNDTAIHVYESSVQNLNYQDGQEAAQTINQWVEDRTNNKIKNLIDPNSLTPSTVLVLVNALYFSGNWVHRFDSVVKGPFHVSATESKEVDFMSSEAWAKYGHDDKLKAKFLELQFQGGKVSMTFVLPDSRTGLTAVEQNLLEYIKPRTLERARVDITLPKFKIETKIDFKPILQSLGITDIFLPSANLSGISDGGQLKVDFVVQKAFIDCNQDGVEAAAATAVDIFAPSAIPPPEYNFEADHPFFFFIKENYYGTILFAGRFNK